MCAAVAGAVAIIIRRIAGPVADIVSAADRIAHRDYDVRVREPEFGPAWVGDTARAFNAMASELDAQDKARRHLMADIAHELRTPLAIVQGKLEGLLDGVYPRDDERLQGLLEDTRVLGRLVEDLRTLSTAESGALALSKEPTDILALANDVVSSLSAHAESAGVALRVETDSPDEIEPIAIDPLRIREVLTNLVANALRYTPRGGRVLVGVGSRAGGRQRGSQGRRHRRGHLRRGAAAHLRSLLQRRRFVRLGARADDRARPRRGARRDDPCREPAWRRNDDRRSPAAVASTSQGVLRRSVRTRYRPFRSLSSS